LSSLITPPAHTYLFTLSLHDALPIYSSRSRKRSERGAAPRALEQPAGAVRGAVERRPSPRPTRAGDRRNARLLRRRRQAPRRDRSEEHTSELQSRRELVCRLLLEKKK